MSMNNILSAEAAKSNGEMPPRPMPCKGDLANLPHALRELIALPRWVVWKYEWNGKKWTKPPYNAASLRYASNNDPKTWASYELALNVAAEGDFARHGGIGFNFLGSDVSGFDLDNCRDADTGEIDAWALDLVKAANSYTEVSPSGTGLRIFGKTSADSSEIHIQAERTDGRIGAKCEVYRRCKRYATVTGLKIAEAPDELANLDGLMDQLAASCEASRAKGNAGPIHFSPTVGTVDIDALPLEKELGAYSAEDVRALIRDGCGSRFNGDRSRAVWAVVCKLRRAEVSPDDMRDILLDEQYRISDHIYDQPRPRRYAEKQVKHAFKKVSEDEVGVNRKLAEAQSEDNERRFMEHVGLNGHGLNGHERILNVVDPIQEPSGAQDEKPRDPPAEEPLFDPWAEYPVPGFPFDTLPGWLSSYIRDESRMIGCDPSGYAMSVLVTLSAALSHEFRICPMRNSPWEECPRLWGLLVGDPSAKKSPSMRSAVRALRKLEEEQQLDYKRRCAEWQAHNAAADANTHVDPEPTAPPRLIIGDVTPEMLAELLARHPRGTLICRDEVSGLLGGFGRYSSKGGASERAAYLELWNGGPYTKDRVSAKQKELFVQNFSASVLGGIQPERLKGLTDLQDDGLLQRFLPVICGAAHYPCEIDGDIGRGKYEDLVKRCVRAQPQRIILCSEAHDEFNRLRRELFDLEQASTGLAKGFTQFIGKLSGYAASIALILHVIDNPEQAWRAPTVDTVRKVARIIDDFIVPHALEVYRGVEETDCDRLKAMASYVLTARERNGSEKTRFVTSDFPRNVACTRGMDVKQIEALVSLLVAIDWLIVEEEPPRIGRGRPKVLGWKLNPRVRVEFEQREQDEERRKGAVAKAMNSRRRNAEAP